MTTNKNVLDASVKMHCGCSWHETTSWTICDECSKLEFFQAPKGHKTPLELFDGNDLNLKSNSGVKQYAFNSYAIRRIRNALEKYEELNTRPQPCGDAVDGKDYKKLYWDLLESWSDLKIKHGVLQEKLEAALTQPKADVEGLKKIPYTPDEMAADYFDPTEDRYVSGWNDCIDHLAARGCFGVLEGYALVPIEKQFDGKTFRLVAAEYGCLQDISLTVRDMSVLKAAPKKETK